MTDTDSPLSTLGRLTAVEITNYRGYRGNFRLNVPNGENLIIYGENGSGKSSFYHSIRTFLEAPDLRIRDGSTARMRALNIADNAYRFTTEPPELSLEFGPQIFKWNTVKNDPRSEPIRLLNQGKGFLDYKALLEVHYVRDGEDGGVDLFPLFVKRLLPYYTYPTDRGTVSFQSGWLSLKSKVIARWRGNAESDFRRDLAFFNDALETTVDQIAEGANAMLTAFGDEFAVTFTLERADFRTSPKRIIGPKLLVRPAYRALEIRDYHDFFNEAKLSALAICMFFAALKGSPATGLRLLALDDVLIGLDMSNRVKVLDLVHEHFSSWQILIFTYSRAWFESLKERVKADQWNAAWIPILLREEKTESDESPRIVAEGNGDLLETAERHLQRRDFTAAAVYARKALEAFCHVTCAKAALSVIHIANPKHRTLEHLFVALRHRLDELLDDSRRAMSLRLLQRLEIAREYVLNRNAHFDVEEEDTLSAEVATGVDSVRRFVAFLKEQDWHNSNFVSGRKLSSQERMTADITVARDLAARGAPRQCQLALRRAYDNFWVVYGKRIGALVPIGMELNAPNISSTAEQQNRISAEDKLALSAAKPYLYGTVKGPNFSLTRFETAVSLLEQLSAGGTE